MNNTTIENEKLYLENEKLISTTIHREYPARKGFMLVHGIGEYDLVQYGRLGLQKAVETFDPSLGHGFQTHAIRNIIWSINVWLKKDSLGNADNRSLELVDRVSMDKTFNTPTGEEITLHEVYKIDDRGYENFEMNDAIASLGEIASPRLEETVRLLLKGYTYEEVGDKMGVSKQAVHQMIKRNIDILRDVLLAS